MSRVPLINPNDTSPDRQAVLSQIHAAFGATPTCSKPWPIHPPH